MWSGSGCSARPTPGRRPFRGLRRGGLLALWPCEGGREELLTPRSKAGVLAGSFNFASNAATRAVSASSFAISFRVGRQCRVQPRPERHDQRLLFRAGKLAEVGKRWRVSHPYLDSHLHAPRSRKINIWASSRRKTPSVEPPGRPQVSNYSFGIKSTAQERPNAKIPRPGDVRCPGSGVVDVRIIWAFFEVPICGFSLRRSLVGL